MTAEGQFTARTTPPPDVDNDPRWLAYVKAKLAAIESKLDAYLERTADARRAH